MGYNITSVDYINGRLYMTESVRSQLEEKLNLPESCFLQEQLYEALSHTTGSADLLLTWEGGDSHTGIRVVNGKVTKHEVVFALGDEVKS